MAIKVNGTTVINDSRTLSNIASVDATTVNSVTNAGVGGSATSLFSANTEPSSPSVGDCYYDSTVGTNGTLYIYDGSDWGFNNLS